MLRVDIISAYLICGVASLVGAAMMRIAETNDAQHRQALRASVWALGTLGVALLPVGVPGIAGHPVVQWAMTAGSMAGVAILSRGLALLQARRVPGRHMAAVLAASAIGCALPLALAPQTLWLGWIFAGGMAAITTLNSWLTRGFVFSPRDPTERLLGVVLGVLTASMWLRFGFTVFYVGPVRTDQMYVPEPLASMFAATYGVLPMIVSTLLLNLVNTRLRQQLRAHAHTDELTGALTRRALRELAPGAIAQEQAGRRVAAVMMLDLDRFKVINDTHGHGVGDLVLQSTAATLRAQLRADALLARYGGEEFVAVVPVDDLPVARRVADRLRAAVADVDWHAAAGLTDPVTVSIGVALVDASETLDDALRRADEALYRAKRGGRNQCQVSLMAA